MGQTAVTIEGVDLAAEALANRWRDRHVTAVCGVPRGGIVPAVMVASKLGVPVVGRTHTWGGTLIVDDLVDSGATAKAHDRSWGFDALYRKPHSPAGYADDAIVVDDWLVFPWEVGAEDAGPVDAVRRLLEFVGEDPNRDGLADTPDRVVRSFAELTDGYHVDVAALLSTQFDARADEMILVTGIDFTALCEHHLLPFTGTATVGYVPADGKVVGLSKLARVVDAFAHRLQVQERMTEQIASAIVEHTGAIGVGVIVRARHACMGHRGVRKPGAEMVTSSMLGALRDKPEARAEFLALARG